jgi:hypothetical protein
MAEEVEVLARMLLAHSPPKPQLLIAARGAADAILHLRRVQAARRSAIDAAARGNFEMPGTGAEIHFEPCLHELLCDPRDPIGVLFTVRRSIHRSDQAVRSRDGAEELATVLADPPTGFRQLDEYERRALSHRRTELRRLDCERIDAERRRKPH